ncbi:MAG: alpha/beta hydrolase [Clostridiales bacterium]|nr:alpha/beta hydrolase [Clostridiales bacterium]
MRKLAVVFPGIGYHTDKPLLYYGKKLAAADGYEIVDVTYGELPAGAKGSAAKMEEAGRVALSYARKILENLDFSQYDRILFLSKSLGTAVGAAYARERGLAVSQVYYTPVEQTFRYPAQRAVAFHGTKDQWVETPVVKDGCERQGIPLFITEGANHSLETGDAEADIRNLAAIIRQTREFMQGLEC